MTSETEETDRTPFGRLIGISLWEAFVVAPLQGIEWGLMYGVPLAIGLAMILEVIRHYAPGVFE